MKWEDSIKKKNGQAYKPLSGWRDTDISGIKPLTRFNSISRRYPVLLRLLVIRQHWSVKNQLHWVLDVTFNEDASRIRRGHGAENFTFLRRMAIGILNKRK